MAETRGSAAGVTWDLGDLYAGVDDPRIQQDLDQGLLRRRRSRQVSRQDRRPGGPGRRRFCGMPSSSWEA